MDFDQVARWFEGMGIHPVLGGMLLGAAALLLLRGLFSRGASTAVDLSGRMSSPAGGRSTITRAEFGLASAEIRVTHNGREIVLPPEASRGVMHCIGTGDMIGAIKLVRAHSGLDLLDAKALVDTLARNRGPKS